MSNLSLAKDKIRILLLEGVHENAVRVFENAGYSNIEFHKKALDEDVLKEKIKDAHIVGIRSRTQLTEEVINSAEKLFSVGCFCIGTNQVSLRTALTKGVPVFNAPYSNTRSVAELVLGEAIMLMRGIPAKSESCHAGGWMKSATGSYEVRGKTLGIIGYGHIGSQLSILAEAVGLKVVYFDVVNKLPLGNATPCESMDQLLQMSDIVSLHVPDTAETRNMIGARELGEMKAGAHFINAARGQVVEIPALADALKDGHIAGAAIDVFPVEPKGADDEFVSELRGIPNVILTPHIGGSTQEAQANIGTEVAEKLVKYSDDGSTFGAVNFMEVSLPVKGAGTRFMHIHENKPGVMAHISEIMVEHGFNILGQFLQTDGEYGYVVVDVDADIEKGQGVRQALRDIPGTIRVRFLR
ncbi:D-3-phosphoglycerate dehydrogenase [Candidatus Terasakiella magnetica]|uniref:D-3-phosphoglycerate dehydrogenase n=1 Tax=Candidatus Terasakiella magnetica TaxID=1867952 RepID=A0A1C3RII1_9PROT|nr:phosphoglycerate dehydrogenase [Candidatus Terasakiella magnetica]SCA57076.1 D-3-phosphoglycerate dehydrogenase [Candidatus Terasakiella magnetica]